MLVRCLVSSDASLLGRWLPSGYVLTAFPPWPCLSVSTVLLIKTPLGLDQAHPKDLLLT